MERLWIIPKNDLEAFAIYKMLQRNNENYLVTGQAWGASWDKLEDDIKEKILEYQAKGDIQVYGVELQGSFPKTINVDHHSYGNDDRTNSKSSLEQVAEILGVDLNYAELFISEGDKGSVEAVRKLGKELQMSDEKIDDILSIMKSLSFRIQGITKEQEEQSAEAVKALGEIDGVRDYIEIEIPHSKTVTVTDKLQGKYLNLLIISGDGETNFYGQTEYIMQLKNKFVGGWSGGKLDEGHGFWGGYFDQSEIRTFVRSMMEKIKDNENR
jgi:hypothetical protein